MNRMLEYLWLWWKTLIITHKINRVIRQQEKTMALMSDVVILMGGVSAKLDTLLAQAPVATQAQVDAVAQGLADMSTKLDNAIPPATPAP